METKIITPSEDNICLAADMLKNGHLVAIPTETVYGLAANAYNDVALREIFSVKGRPQDNPLILHISRLEQLTELAQNIPDTAYKLVRDFWPGALTMVFDRTDRVSDTVSGGLNTVAVRMPDNEYTLALIDRCAFPLAAPSANISGKPSPTSAQHVYSDFNGKIPLIIDGGECSCGVESTVIALDGGSITILRPGAVTAEELGGYSEVVIDKAVFTPVGESEKVTSPGQKYKHYSPKAELILVSGGESEFREYANAHAGENVYFLVFGNEKDLPKKNTFSYGIDGKQQAALLFSCLRNLDGAGAEKVYVRCPDKTGISLAVYNRLLRAAGFKIITL